MKKLLINEIFWSIQGEGLFTGTPAVFLRLQGCHANCPFCDTRYAQAIRADRALPDNADKICKKTTADDWYSAVDSDWILSVLEQKKSSYKPCVILTGGEPFEQPIAELVRSLLDAHYPVHIETNGQKPIDVPKEAWITLSPKKVGVTAKNWLRANEIKLVVRDAADIADFEPWLATIDQKKILLQPVDCDPKATKLCAALCMEHNWRLSVQVHKYLGLR